MKANRAPVVTVPLTLRYERDPKSRMWVVSVDEIEGAHTQGKTLDQASARIADVLTMCADEIGEMAAKGLEGRKDRCGFCGFIHGQTVRECVMKKTGSE